MMFSSRIADVITNRLNLGPLDQLFQQIIISFLLLNGFAGLDWIINRRLSLSSSNALPKRPTSSQEWLRGVALGWGMTLVTILPIVVAGSFHPLFWFSPRSWGLAVVALFTIVLLALNLELAFRGYIFVHLIAAIGPEAASILLSLLYALLSSLRPNSTSVSIAVTFLFGLLFSAAYLRTHALWLGCGVHFAWYATMALLLGLPVAAYTTLCTPISATVSGPLWLSGGAYGPEGAALSVMVVIPAVFILYRMTRGYAWDYTHEPIVPMGYAVTIAPPAAHTAIEAEAAAKLDALVQIGAAPSMISGTPVTDDRTRSKE